MGESAKPYAVLMGDLVDSEGVTSAADLSARFNEVITRQNERHADRIASPLTITLGDEFQGLIASLSDAAGIARDLRLALLDHGIDCRLAIGVVTLATPLNTERAWNMMGPGLAATRSALNEKRATNHYRFVLPADPVVQTLLEAIGAGITAIERNWTATQRGAIDALLSGVSATELAARRGVSLSTAYKVRRSGQYDLYVTQWDAVRTALAAIDAALHLGEGR